MPAKKAKPKVKSKPPAPSRKKKATRTSARRTKSSARGLLAEYERKRNFGVTPEPSGRKSLKSQKSEPRFVVQKHAASRLHYDFRLEADGVLKSWAVPKGPSLDPGDKRLAVPTEDHPLDYIDFEGVIPAGNYGAGTVIVWDTGTYENITERHGRPVSMTDALERGHVVVRLHGKKLRGGFALTRTNFRGEKSWLLVKMDDEEAEAGSKILETKPNSVLTRRSLERVSADESGA